MKSRGLYETDIPRIRVGSLEPWDLPDNFWSLFDNPRLMPHLHLPLQSGTNSVLKRMSRRCKTQDYAGLIRDARKAVPDINITTDIILGFPGETEKEWEQGLAFIEQMKFGHIHIFAYSPRQGTKAANLPQSVSRDTKRQRSEQLHALAERMKQETLQRFVHRPFEILVEGSPESKNGETLWSGYTPNYLRVTVPSEETMETE